MLDAKLRACNMDLTDLLKGITNLTCDTPEEVIITCFLLHERVTYMKMTRDCKVQGYPTFRDKLRIALMEECTMQALKATSELPADSPLKVQPDQQRALLMTLFEAHAPRVG